MKKIKLNCAATMEEIFADFLTSRKAKGLADKTLQSYEQQFRAVARHLDVKTDIAMLQKADLDAMIVSMREAGLSSNSINSYTRTLKSFFSWCNEQGITRLNIPLYKAEETVKETYSDAELSVLLKKPDIRKTTFAEYRDWVIINFLLNCGCRAATVRAIQIRDVDLDGGVVFYRHTKNRKTQVIPLCSPMIAILREYQRYRSGESTDYLFCTETGSQLRQTQKSFSTIASCSPVFCAVFLKSIRSCSSGCFIKLYITLMPRFPHRFASPYHTPIRQPVLPPPAHRLFLHQIVGA